MMALHIPTVAELKAAAAADKLAELELLGYEEPEVKKRRVLDEPPRFPWLDCLFCSHLAFETCMACKIPPEVQEENKKRHAELKENFDRELAEYWRRKERQKEEERLRQTSNFGFWEDPYLDVVDLKHKGNSMI